MAEPIGISSGIVALATFAFKSSTSLYNAVRDYQNHTSRVRDLLKELEALTDVLRSLTATLSVNADFDLTALEIPLRRCDHACKEFEQELAKCTSRSGGTRASFRDWAKLRYMGEDIDSFRHLLAGYKSTINIALADASLRRSSLTLGELKSCQELVRTTTSDLEAHLESIDEKLESILTRNTTDSNLDTADLLSLEEERLSTQQCLQICAQLSDHIDQIQIPIERGRNSSAPSEPETMSEKIASEGLEECKASLRATAAKLESHMLVVLDRLITKSRTAISSEEDVEDLVRLREEWAATRQSVRICSRADSHLKAGISTIENFAAGDETIQFMVSTDGKTLHGKNRGMGFRNKQVGGHLSDLSLQYISRDITASHLHITSNATSPRDELPSFPDDGVEVGSHSEFRQRHGPGFKLAEKPAPDVAATRPPKGAASSAPRG